MLKMTFFKPTFVIFGSKSSIIFYIFFGFEKSGNGEIGKGMSKMAKNGRFLGHLEKFWLKILNNFLYIFWL